MVTISIAAITLFAALIVFFRSFTMETGRTEEELGFTFLYVFIASCILSPLFLYLSNRLDKYKRPTDDL